MTLGKGQQAHATLLEAVRASLAHAALYNPGDVVAPAAVLWTDADGQWRSLVERLRTIVPELLTLGDYDPATRTGPAIWLRSVIEPAVWADKFPELAWTRDTVPVIYMPGVSRQTLRTVEECPNALKPLVELQYRGTVWAQKNGKDWTVLAFLVSGDGGLGLDVAEDRLTHQSMLGAFSQLAVTPVSQLTGRRLEAEDFDHMMVGDPPQDLLLWLGNPAGTRERWDMATCSAFRSRCREEYGFDPEGDGELVGGEKLGERRGAWQGVWRRFSVSPTLYPGVPDLLRRSRPSELIVEPGVWPNDAESMEDDLRAALAKLGLVTAVEARASVAQLEAVHGVRRTWVWARLGMCPLAEALAHLSALATRTETVLGGDSAESLAHTYVEGGYLADDAALRALTSVKTAKDALAVQAAVLAVYLPWLEDTTRHFQELLAQQPLPGALGQKVIEAEAGECILFVDGLRFDLGQRLVLFAAEEGLDTSHAWRWAGLPTVTATAKPAVSPVADKLRGGQLGESFEPALLASSDRLTTDRFRKLVSEAGYQVLGAAEEGDPHTESARAWTEYGEFDRLGHDLGAKLAGQIDGQLELVLERARGLLEAGWRRVRVLTDHGWLLVPGGMPKVLLPKYLTESRWSRCASIKETSHVEVPVAGWHWNQQEYFAHAPGVHCFAAGQEYAHGGVSLQECVIPVLTLTSTTHAAGTIITVKGVQWVGLRCRVAVAPAVAGFEVDLRTKPNDPHSSLTEKRPLDADGKASLLVADDALEGTMASLVVLDASGRVVSRQATTVGGDE